MGMVSLKVAYTSSLQHGHEPMNSPYLILNPPVPLSPAVIINRFTTKPYQDSGEVKFIGNVPTPWESWSVSLIGIFFWCGEVLKDRSV